jgi:hypothetical protein
MEEQMQRTRLLSVVSLLGGLVLVLTGLLHSTVTPSVYRGLSATLPQRAVGLTYFFAAFGLYVALSGWLMIYASRGLGRGERWARVVSLTNGMVNAVAGVGALAAGFRDPVVWAWLMAAAAIVVAAAIGAVGRPAASRSPAASSIASEKDG